jgi:hypothetical protein
VVSAAFSTDGKRVMTASAETARIWDVGWVMLVRADALRERVCSEIEARVLQRKVGGKIFGGIAHSRLSDFWPPPPAEQRRLKAIGIATAHYGRVESKIE